MARPLRIQFDGAIYHICARGNDRRRIFQAEADRYYFLELLEKSARRFDVSVLCFVLMENHFHLVAQTRRPNLVRWMHWLMVSYTVFFNRRHRRSGHLFQGRYKSFLVEQGEYLLGLSRYVHLNPVRGMSLGRGTPGERRRRLRNFKWSSYRGYAGLAKPFPFVAEATVLDELSGASRAQRLRYRRFTEEGLLREIDNAFHSVQWQAVLGSESFVQRVRDRMKGLHKEKREVTSVRRSSRAVSPHQILRRVATKFRLSPRQLLETKKRGLVARNLAMWMIWEISALTLREIGEMFGNLDYAAVAQRIRRIRLSYSLGATNKLLIEMSNV
jgi:REP element-mobilizing transposase RayT